MVSKEKQNRNPKKKSGSFGAGIFIFGIVLIYLIVMIAMYFTKDHVTSYEVQMGNLSYSTTLQGVILRQEEIVTADSSGSVTYYVSQGGKVRVGSNLYTVNANSSQQVETGENTGELTSSDYSQLQSSVAEFRRGFDAVSFDGAYDYHYKLSGELLELRNKNMSEELKELALSQLSDSQIRKAEKDGIIAYTIDGLEGLTVEDISDSVFNKKGYNKQDLRDAESISTGDPVYKLVTSELWSICVLLDDETYNYIQTNNKKSLEVKIDKDDCILWANVTCFDVYGTHYANLQFQNSMVRYLSDRYLDVTLVMEEASGLKIPNSSIMEKEFYVIPNEYISTTNGSAAFVYVKTENGPRIINIDIYHEDEEQNTSCVDTSVLSKGDELVQADTQQTYTVGETQKLLGVYNVNKGYAVFKQIETIYSNEEYSIIKEGTSYGISNYDFIALDGDTVEEDDIIYK